MHEIYEELERELRDREALQDRIDKTLEKLYNLWAKELAEKKIAELNILEKLNGLTDDQELKTEFLNGFIKVMRSKNQKCLMLERTVAGRYLQKADQDLLSLSLYKLDYMHNLFNSLRDKKKIEELNKVYEKLSDVLINAWGIKGDKK